MKLLYVTDRVAIGDERFSRLLAELAGASELSVGLRERGTPDRQVLTLASTAKMRLGPDVSLFLHRRFDLAVAVQAEGVQLPETGLPLARVRAAAPRGLRVGVSVHSPAGAAAAIEDGADRVVIGPIFDTPSKREYGSPLGPSALGALPRTSDHACEVFAIGGIDERRLDELEPWRDRISGVAAIRMIQDAHEPRSLVEKVAAR